MNNIPLEIAILQVTITPMHQFQLPSYPAITIRGGLGYAFHQVLDDKKLYSKLFEDFNGETVDGQYIPYTRPFIIRTGYNGKQTYKSGEKFTFEILLYGEAIRYYQYFLLAMNAFGQNGIGKEKQPFKVVEIISLGEIIPRKIFANNDLIKAPYVWKVAELNNGNISSNLLELNFTTPARLKLQGENQREFGIVEVVDSLLRRIDSLLYFHHGKFLVDRDWKEDVLQSAFDSETVDVDFHYVAFERFSTRQKQKMYIDGVEGNVVASNIDARLAKLLYFGQYVHIGKQTVFGLGQYKLYSR